MINKLEVGKIYRNVNPYAGKTINKYGKSFYIAKQLTVVTDNGPLVGLKIHSYRVIDDHGNFSTIDDDDLSSLEPIDEFVDVQKHINDYTKWFAKEMYSAQIGEYHEVTLLFLDINNDYIQFYVKQDGNDIILSDDGHTLHTLCANGCEISPNKEQFTWSVLHQFGVSLENNALTMTVSANEFLQKLNMFVQAMLVVNSIYLDACS